MTVLAYLLAALGEIAGCYAFWAVFRLGQAPYYLVAGMVSLAAFAYCLTLVDVAAAGRAFAIYGGIYILSALVWLRLVEGITPDAWDLLGGAVALTGALIIFLGPHRTL